MKKALVSILAVLALSSTALAGDNYKLDIKAPSAKKGEKAKATLHVEGTGGFHVNTEYPFKLTLKAPAGVKLDKETFVGGKDGKSADAAKWTKEGLDFDINFTSSDTGKKEITGDFKFAVCTADNCSPGSKAVAIDVDVK